MSDSEVPRCHRIKLMCVKFEEVSLGVDEHVALEGFLSSYIIANAVVGKVVEDFHGEEEAR